MTKNVIIKKLNKTERLLSLDDTERVKSGHVVLMPGEVMPLHVTTGREEVILVLKGKAEITADNSVHLVGTKGLIYIPPETPHMVKNVGKLILEYVYVVAMLA